MKFLFFIFLVKCIEYKLEMGGVWNIKAYLNSYLPNSYSTSKVFKDRWHVLPDMLLIEFYTSYVIPFEMSYFINFDVFNPLWHRSSGERILINNSSSWIKIQGYLWKKGFEILFSEIIFEKRINHQCWAFQSFGPINTPCSFILGFLFLIEV